MTQDNQYAVMTKMDKFDNVSLLQLILLTQIWLNFRGNLKPERKVSGEMPQSILSNALTIVRTCYLYNWTIIVLTLWHITSHLGRGINRLYRPLCLSGERGYLSSVHKDPQEIPLGILCDAPTTFLNATIAAKHFIGLSGYAGGQPDCKKQGFYCCCSCSCVRFSYCLTFTSVIIDHI